MAGAATLPDDATEAIKLLYAQEGSAVYRTIYGIVLDAAEAQDLTQETFVRVYRTWHHSDHAGARSWLIRVAADLALTHDPAEPRQVRVTHRIGPKQGGAHEPGRRPDDRDVVAWLMQPLTPEERALVTLSYYQQIPPDEIADQLGIPIGTVALRLEGAMRILRRQALALSAMQPSEVVAG